MIEVIVNKGIRYILFTAIAFTVIGGSVFIAATTFTITRGLVYIIPAITITERLDNYCKFLRLLI